MGFIHIHAVVIKESWPFYSMQSKILHAAILNHVILYIIYTLFCHWQFNKENTADTFDLYGSVSCKSDLEVALSDVTINLSYNSPESAIPMDNLLIHPCVQSADCSMLQRGKPTHFAVKFYLYLPIK